MPLSLYICIIYMHIYIYTYIHVYICVCACVCSYIYLHTFVCFPQPRAEAEDAQLAAQLTLTYLQMQILREPFPDLLNPADFFKRPTYRRASDYNSPVSYDYSADNMKRLFNQGGVKVGKVTLARVNTPQHLVSYSN